MGISKLLTLPALAGALLLAPRPAPAQVSVSLHLGRNISIGAYSAARYGDWHTNYRRWRPVTVYYYNGDYYPHAVRGGRAVMVYRYQNSYFLPPEDTGWNRADHRYNYRRRPDDNDYNRARGGHPGT
ncbi:MAG: hypothetical protein ACREL5_05485 [Gemmatimonadales bacterium]